MYQTVKWILIGQICCLKNGALEYYISSISWVKGTNQWLQPFSFTDHALTYLPTSVYTHTGVVIYFN